MSRRSNQKLKLLYLSKILLEQTDDTHGLTLSQISEELMKYGVEAGRKSLYDDMEALRVYGIDVRTRRDRYVRYYVGDRTFDRAELKIIADLICDSRFITAKKANELIRKLQGISVVKDMLPEYEQRLVERASVSEDAFKNMELICKAMAEDRKITFRCFEWNPYKQRVLVRGGELFCVSPWKLIVYNRKYHLIAFDHLSKEIRAFSPERMLDISVINKKREGRSDVLSFDTDTCIRQAEEANVRLFCDNSVAGDVVERFGVNVTVLANREDHFEISTKVCIDADFFAWMFTMKGKVRIISPEWVSDQYEQMLVAGRGK